MAAQTSAGGPDDGPGGAEAGGSSGRGSAVGPAAVAVRVVRVSKGFSGMQLNSGSGNTAGGGTQVDITAAERLSALLDGELDPGALDELLAECEREPALGAQWSRMAAAQAANEGVRFSAVSLNFASGVMAALDDEPAARPASAQVVDLAAARAARSGRAPRNLWRPAYGLAAAASIAAVAVLTAVGSHKGDDATLAGLQPAATPVAALNADTPAAQRGVVPVALKSGAVSTAAIPETGWSQLDPDSARLFDDYVIEHSNYRVVPGMTGSLSYARFATYSTANGSR